MRDLIDILTRYEGAVNAVEVDGDETALDELTAARAELMEVLRIARAWDEAGRPGQQIKAREEAA